MSERWNAAQQGVIQPDAQRWCKSGGESRRDEANAHRGAKKERGPELHAGQERKSAEAKRNLLAVARIVREAGKGENERGIIKMCSNKGCMRIAQGGGTSCGLAHSGGRAEQGRQISVATQEGDKERTKANRSKNGQNDTAMRISASMQSGIASAAAKVVVMARGG
jgi:hypothetical protein